jgi:hypothetical protein
LTVNSGNIISIGGKYTYSGISAGIQTASAASITGARSSPSAIRAGVLDMA